MVIREKSGGEKSETVQMTGSMSLTQRYLSEVATNSLHGVSNLVQSQNACAKFLWGSLIATMLCGTVLHASMIIKQFASDSNRVSSISKQSIRGLKYPGISLCLGHGGLFDYEALAKDNISAKFAEKVMQEIGFRRLSQTADIDLETGEVTSMSWAEFVQFYEKYGIVKSKFITKCTTPGANCVSNFKPTYHAVHGLCFSQNTLVHPSFVPGRMTQSTLLINSVPACPPGKLPCALNLKLGNDGVSQAAFSSVEREFPLPGGLITVQIHSVVRQIYDAEVPQKWHCFASESDLPNLRYFQSYTLENCFRDKMIYSFRHWKGNKTTDDCVLPIILFTNPKGAESETICSKKELLKTRLHSHQPVEFFTGVNVGDRASGCVPLCDYVTYHYDFDYRPIESNTTLISFFFQDMTITVIREVSPLSWYEYLSLGGGVLGLWLGSSLITIVHAIASSVYFAVLGIQKRIRKSPDRHDSVTEMSVVIA